MAFVVFLEPNGQIKSIEVKVTAANVSTRDFDRFVESIGGSDWSADFRAVTHEEAVDRYVSNYLGHSAGFAEVRTFRSTAGWNDEESDVSPSISFDSPSKSADAGWSRSWHLPEGFKIVCQSGGGGTSDGGTGRSFSNVEQLTELVAKLSQQVQEIRDRLSLLEDDGK